MISNPPPRPSIWLIALSYGLAALGAAILGAAVIEGTCPLDKNWKTQK